MKGASASVTPLHQHLAGAGRGTARARTYNVGLARTVMEVRLARVGPMRLELGRRRAHVRQLDGRLPRVAGIKEGVARVIFQTGSSTHLSK
jgi:hypothetical protein